MCGLDREGRARPELSRGFHWGLPINIGTICYQSQQQRLTPLIADHLMAKAVDKIE